LDSNAFNRSMGLASTRRFLSRKDEEELVVGWVVSNAVMLVKHEKTIINHPCFYGLYHHIPPIYGDLGHGL